MADRNPQRSNAAWGVEIQGATQLKRALKVLGEKDAPFLREALTEAGHILQHETSSRAPGGIARKVGFTGVKGVGGALRAVVKIDHPGGRSMEFGRIWYYRQSTYYRQHGEKSGIGNNRPGSKRVKGGIKAKAQKSVDGGGQQNRPYLGIVDGGAAIAASKSRVVELLNDAFEREWERIGAEAD